MNDARPAGLAGSDAVVNPDALLRWLRVAVAATSALVIGSWCVIACAHVDDNYGFDQVTGVWLALARYVNEGTLYPPLFNGHDFGGTRYMPLQFVAHAGLAHVTGDYLVSSRLAAYASAIALFTLMFVICRRISGSAVLAAGLVAAVLSTETGLSDTITIHGDALAAALQLGAVYVVTRRSPDLSTRATVTGGALCALAFFSKFTAVWAAVALAIWLALRGRRQLALFLGALFITGGVLFAVFEVASSGRMTENLIALGNAGTHLPPIDTIAKFILLGQDHATALWVLAPFAIAGLVVGVARRRLSVYQTCLLIAFVIVLPVLRDIGADSNHLIDIEVLTAIVFAEVVASATAPRILYVVACAAIVWGTLTSYYVNVRHDTAAAARELAGRRSPYSSRPPLPLTVTKEDRILSDDAYVSVARGENPVVLDPFMLIAIDLDHPDWQAKLVREIADRRFTKIVTRGQIHIATMSRWWRLYNLGDPVVDAILANYRLVNVPDGAGTYAVYEPR